ncbi:hypothetical protein LPJ66_004642 [Kickxella alabastrina]|uniref:Uncharacterized protein n=1 Tax=Kickxella alabastrina TaxID=61397 RepID=A0ACC1IGS7_9FUNG|nr:hypothetical protein LPJ66_004642 [Kickxella alabastrina]
MSQSMGKPWLVNMFADKNLQLDETPKRVRRLVQLISIIRHGPDEVKYPVVCEISDKKHFMRAIFSKGALKSMEKLSNQPVESLRGAIFQVDVCVPKIYVPGADSTKDRKYTYFPKHVRDNNTAQFWMVISKTCYMGGEGNNTFDEPEFIHTNRYVNERLNELAITVYPQLEHTGVAERGGCGDCLLGSLTAANHTETEGTGLTGISAITDFTQHVDQIDLDANDVFSWRVKHPELHLDDNFEAETTELFSPKRQRLSSYSSPECEHDFSQWPPIETQRTPNTPCNRNAATQRQRLPTVCDVPFVADMKAAWECNNLWESLSIQYGSIPFMPTCTLKPQPQGQTQITQQTQPHTRQLQGNTQPSIPNQRPSLSPYNDPGFIISSFSATQDSIVDPPTNETSMLVSLARVNRQVSYKEKVYDDLNGLLRPAGSNCTDSKEIMSALFGDINSSNPPTPSLDNLDASVSHMLSGQSRDIFGAGDYWEQSPQAVINLMPTLDEME